MEVKQRVTKGLRETLACCVPGAGVVSIACRGAEHTSAILDGAESTCRAEKLFLAMTTEDFKKCSCH